MSNTIERFVKIDDWIFEIKSIRAIRVEKYGQPYDAIANFSINGENAYIDGLMTREEEIFTRKDHQTFIKFCKKLAIKEVTFDRFKQLQTHENVVNIHSSVA